jgi:hypothetical protein
VTFVVFAVAIGVFVAARSVDDDARFVRLRPPMWRSLRIVSQPQAQFDRWFRNESLGAQVPANGLSLFRNAGCGYCHVIRGAADMRWRIGPDLTHFASRTTIGAAGIPKGQHS